MAPWFRPAGGSRSPTPSRRRSATERIDAIYRDASLAELALLPINIEPDTSTYAWSATLRFAERFSLPVYEAAYLELANRHALPLAIEQPARGFRGGLGIGHHRRDALPDEADVARMAIAEARVALTPALSRKRGEGGRRAPATLSRLREREGPIAQQWEGEGASGGAYLLVSWNELRNLSTSNCASWPLGPMYQV